MADTDASAAPRAGMGKPSLRSAGRKVARRAVPDYLDPAYWGGTIKMSLSRFFVLCVLHERPMHGYEMARAVERATRGCCSPSEGTVYPMLADFEAGGYVSATSEIVDGRERKVYALTAKGHEAFRVAVASWLEVTGYILASRAAVADTPTAAGCGG